MRRSSRVRGALGSAMTRIPLLDRVVGGAWQALAALRTFDDLARAAARRNPERVAVFEYPYSQNPAPEFAAIAAILARHDFADAYARLEGLRGWVDTIPLEAPPPAVPTWRNDWFLPLDALTLASLLVEHRPSTYLEVGSGTSTAFARSVIRHYGLPTRIVSIDPSPRAEIDALCDEVVRAPLEDADVTQFARLGANDLLFFDGSHRSFPGSDATRFFLEIVPSLRSGVVWGIHDVFLPSDYPADWCLRQRRYYNEQYLLATYLLGGGGRDVVILPNAYAPSVPRVSAAIAGAVRGTTLEGSSIVGGAFWMARS